MQKNLFKNKIILITGATGSIGSAITEEILGYNCKVVRAMSNDENGIYKLSEELTKKNDSLNINMKKNKIRYLVGDIRDQKRCNSICEGVDIVIHAAAMKHVPICEYNPEEAKKTNIDGTRNMINAAIKNKVKKFLFISTDKVVNPSSFMGKTKLKAEKLVLNANSKSKITSLAVIRFGNIIGSRGSVLPKFINQVKLNERLTITDRNMTRFFITINVAVKKIIEALNMMNSGEIFIINNMTSLKIYDLANSIKKHFSFKKKLAIQGLREGEKLYEELATHQEMKKSKITKGFIILNNNKKKVQKNYQLKTLNSNHAKLLNQKKILQFLLKSKLI
jgi:UDP-N-acetylglucosamine 4,6-dehydratase/5-epimerase